MEPVIVGSAAGEPDGDRAGRPTAGQAGSARDAAACDSLTWSGSYARGERGRVVHAVACFVEERLPARAGDGDGQG